MGAKGFLGFTGEHFPSKEGKDSWATVLRESCSDFVPQRTPRRLRRTQTRTSSVLAGKISVGKDRVDVVQLDGGEETDPVEET